MNKQQYRKKIRSIIEQAAGLDYVDSYDGEAVELPSGAIAMGR